MSVGVKIFILVHTVTTPIPRDNQRDREQQTLLKSIASHISGNNLPRIILIHDKLFLVYSRLLISTAFVVVTCVCCLWVTGVVTSNGAITKQQLN